MSNHFCFTNTKCDHVECAASIPNNDPFNIGGIHLVRIHAWCRKCYDLILSGKLSEDSATPLHQEHTTNTSSTCQEHTGDHHANHYCITHTKCDHVQCASSLPTNTSVPVSGLHQPRTDTWCSKCFALLISGQLSEDTVDQTTAIPTVEAAGTLPAIAGPSTANALPTQTLTGVLEMEWDILEPEFNAIGASNFPDPSTYDDDLAEFLNLSAYDTPRAASASAADSTAEASRTDLVIAGPSTTTTIADHDTADEQEIPRSFFREHLNTTSPSTIQHASSYPNNMADFLNVSAPSTPPTAAATTAQRHPRSISTTPLPSSFLDVDSWLLSQLYPTNPFDSPKSDADSNLAGTILAQDPDFDNLDNLDDTILGQDLTSSPPSYSAPVPIPTSTTPPQHPRSSPPHSSSPDPDPAGPSTRLFNLPATFPSSGEERTSSSDRGNLVEFRRTATTATSSSSFSSSSTSPAPARAQTSRPFKLPAMFPRDGAEWLRARYRVRDETRGGRRGGKDKEKGRDAERERSP